MKILIPAVILILIALVLLGVRVLFVKDGTFPSTHIKDNPRLRDRGIRCSAQPTKKHK